MTTTSAGEFTTLDGSVVQAEMMRQSDSFAFAALGELSAIELPYLGDELAMLVIVPEPGSFADVEAGLDPSALAAVVDALSPTQVNLGLPRFEIRSQVALADVLRALGMEVAFDPGAADFSAMTGDRDLYIADVVHEAFIAVDEEGTEAAAATAVVMGVTSAPAEPVELVVDRPFVFALRDTTTGAILFLGRVVDPTA